MPDLYLLVLFAHVLGSIAAFGPAFALPLIGAAAGREPEHGVFATRLSAALDDRVVLPLAIVTGGTGFALIWMRSTPVFDVHLRWLLVSIVVYVGAFAFSTLVQRPTVQRLILVSSSPAAAGAEVGAIATRVSRNGMILTALTVLVVFLMVAKPALGG